MEIPKWVAKIGDFKLYPNGFYAFPGRLTDLGSKSEKFPGSFFFQTQINSIFPVLQREGFELIPLSAYIPAGLEIEFVMMQRANNIPGSIQVPFAKNSASMWALVRECIYLFLVPGKAYLFTPDFQDQEVVLLPVQFFR